MNPLNEIQEMNFGVTCTTSRVFIIAMALISSLVLAFPQKGSAQELPQTIYWSGVGFVGNSADKEARSPHLADWVEQIGLAELSMMAWEKLQQVERQDIRLTMDLGRVKSGNAIAMALALDFEQINAVYISPIDSMCASNAQIYAQILFFDMTEGKLLSSFPLHSKRIRDCEGATDELSAEKAEQWISDLMSGEGQSLLNVLPQAYSTLPLNRGFEFNIRVREVKLGKYTEVALGEAGIGKHAYSRWLAAQVTSNLSARAGIPVLPFSLGQAISSKMKVSFSEGSATQIKIPPADFVIDLVARGYIKKAGKEAPARVVNTYIFGLGVSVIDPMLDEVFFDENLHFWETRTENKADGIPPWEGFERQTITGLRTLFDQFAEPDKKWAQMYVKNLRDKKTSWKKVRSALLRVEGEVFGKIRGDGVTEL